MSSPGATLAWRPGVVHGARPERSEPGPGRMARALRVAAGWASVPARASRARVAGFAGTVEREAAGLADLTEAGFEEAVAELRGALRRAGLRDPLVRRSFALVREAARRTLGTPHYDVQLFGGWIMTRRGLAELETGEGKTLAATLPACVAALAGIPVHVITANDYLVERDTASMGPLYARLGLTLGAVTERDPERDARRAAYACDVTYVSNKQVAFDYLRDRLAGGGDRRLARELGVADPGPSGERPVLRGLCFAIVDEADSVLVDDARTPLILSREGARPDEPSVRGALRIARALEPELHFRVDRHRGRAELMPAGRARLEPLARGLQGPLSGTRRREEWVQRALQAEHCLERDRHYLVRDGAIEIVDVSTGRRAPDRSFDGEMQALIEAKEGVALTTRSEAVARLSYQRFFRRYLRLAGMTGTAREVARELWNVYRLRSVSVPTRLPSRRVDAGIRLLPTAEAASQAVLERIRTLHAAGRPVLVGTSSVEASERMSALLAGAGLPHQVLSARQDEEEARVVAQAGQPGRITVATQMAGRGTDIVPGPGVAEAGGLAVVSSDLGEARRIDRQLFGRCARQGSPGSHEQWVSLDDALLRTRLPGWLVRGLRRRAVPRPLAILLTRTAQLAEERRGALARRRVQESEHVLEELLAFSDRRE